MAPTRSPPAEEPKKRGRGRPRKPESERVTKAYVPTGRPRGRPPGSGKGKRAAAKVVPAGTTARTRGRPRKSEVAAADAAGQPRKSEVTAADAVDQSKRPRGQPPGRGRGGTRGGRGTARPSTGRPRGRPRKNPVDAVVEVRAAEEDEDGAKGSDDNNDAKDEAMSDGDESEGQPADAAAKGDAEPPPTPGRWFPFSLGPLKKA